MSIQIGMNACMFYHEAWILFEQAWNKGVCFKCVFIAFVVNELSC